MIIGFDAKRAFLNATGLGNYSRSVIESVTEYYPGHQYFLFTPEPSPLFKCQAACRVITPSGIWKQFHSVWRSRKILSDLRKNNVILFHGLSNELPIGISKTSVQSVVTIHDLIFLRYPHLYPSLDRTIYERKSRQACREADHIIAISDQTREDIESFLGTDAGKISVIYQAINPVYFNETDPDELKRVRNKFHLPEKFILSVGRIEERKNQLSLMKAFRMIREEENIFLVIVGKETQYKKLIDEFISEHSLQTKVVFLPSASVAELAAIYKLALLLAYPSQFEGFGLPIVEALASGCPVVTSDEKVFREAGGSFSIYADSRDEKNFALTILNILSRSEEREKMIREGKQHAVQFMPERHANELMKIYDSIVSS